MDICIPGYEPVWMWVRVPPAAPFKAGRGSQRTHASAKRLSIGATPITRSSFFPCILSR